ncbi:MAG: folate family ECF transporter S component [Clostridia bacterium]|nr:folate family ECF transporter S component [Clostridia bacterium]
MFEERFDGMLDGWKASLNALLTPLGKVFEDLSNPWISLGIIGGVLAMLVLCCVSFRRDSLKKKMQNPRVLTVCAMMMALNIILGYFTLRLSAYLRIGFGFITQPVVGMLFGPLPCLLTGMIQDVISLALNPTGAYIPAYTLSVGISGIFYGMVLYQKPVTLWRVFVAKLLVVLVGNILLNSIALAPTVASGFIGILPSRILKNLLLLPIQTVVSYLILKIVQKQKLLKILEG